ncbi:hypothetical protein ALC60_02225 [Trachymyrmex zeteki]|uniref:Uncharacterized protein n=1 Tax=Mycetomoellerius zeteki TaxID=64791 RepID=A0A151XE34_9HYME|nr:hypothetical protein ALC60_02225 [Trachymyrmex zeteki]
MVRFQDRPEIRRTKVQGSKRQVYMPQLVKSYESLRKPALCLQNRPAAPRTQKPTATVTINNLEIYITVKTGGHALRKKRENGSRVEGRQGINEQESKEGASEEEWKGRRWRGAGYAGRVRQGKRERNEDQERNEEAASLTGKINSGEPANPTRPTLLPLSPLRSYPLLSSSLHRRSLSAPQLPPCNPCSSMCSLSLSRSWGRTRAHASTRLPWRTKPLPPSLPSPSPLTPILHLSSSPRPLCALPRRR